MGSRNRLDQSRNITATVARRLCYGALAAYIKGVTRHTAGSIRFCVCIGRTLRFTDVNIFCCRAESRRESRVSLILLNMPSWMTLEDGNASERPTFTPRQPSRGLCAIHCQQAALCSIKPERLLVFLEISLAPSIQSSKPKVPPQLTPHLIYQHDNVCPRADTSNCSPKHRPPVARCYHRSLADWI